MEFLPTQLGNGHVQKCVGNGVDVWLEKMGHKDKKRNRSRSPDRDRNRDRDRDRSYSRGKYRNEDSSDECYRRNRDQSLRRRDERSKSYRDRRSSKSRSSDRDMKNHNRRDSLSPIAVDGYNHPEEMNRYQKILESIPSPEALEEQIASLTAQTIHKHVEEEVQKYLQCDNFKQMVDVMKRRERERVMTEVIQQIQAEKEAFLTNERSKIEKNEKTVEDILMENQRKIEELKRKEYLEKQQEDANRLLEVQRKRQLEEEEEKRLHEERSKQQHSQDAILLR